MEQVSQSELSKSEKITQLNETTRKERLLLVLNDLCKSLNLTYADISKLISQDREVLLALEKTHPEIVIKADKEGTYARLTAMGLMGTICNILCDEILVFYMDEESGKIENVGFYNKE